ncbi:MAG: ATP-binding protein [Myxococcota bacterium]
MIPPHPRHRLRTRVAFMFLIAIAPAWLATGAAVLVLDQLVAQEITARGRAARAALARHIDAEQDRLQRTLDQLADDPAIRRIVGQIDATDLGLFEGVAARLAASAGLDILAITADTGPYKGLLLSSAHLSEAAEDAAPAFVAAADRRPVGLVYEAVDGNPIQQVPALVAVRAVPAPDTRRPALKIYGGIRLDEGRLEGLAEMSEAQFVLRAPGLGRWKFGGTEDASTESDRRTSRTDDRVTKSADRRATPLKLRFIPGGAASAPKPTKATGAILEIRVGSPRLTQARQQVLRWAPLLIGGSLLLAIALSWLLSRRISHPIRTLSTAAQSVAGGDLSVRVKPVGQDEVGHLMGVFNHMAEELADSRDQLRRAERAAAWQQIARRVAHEIKNPLFPIQMSIETLQKSYDKQHPKLSEIVRESTKTVLEEVQALNRLVTEFSKFARLPPPDRQPLEITKLFAHVLELYGTEGRVVADLEPLHSLPMLHADREQMNRVLINLVKNALEAMDPTDGQQAGKVRLDARLGDGNTVLLTIADDGPGMTPSIQDEIFTPYFTTKPEGTGLGLAIVDRIVAEHGGEILVRSTGQGTTFTLRLPIITTSTADQHRP